MKIFAREGTIKVARIPGASYEKSHTQISYYYLCCLYRYTDFRAKFGATSSGNCDFKKNTSNSVG